MKWFILGAYWRLRIAYYAIRWVPGFNLGDRVITDDGKEWRLSQGVCRPVWTLRRGTEEIELHESQFRKSRDLRNYWGSFANGWRFYRGYWFDIWRSRGLGHWADHGPLWPWRKRG